MASRLAAYLTLASFLAGCARLDTTTGEPSRLPQARLSPDAVVLDIGFVRLPVSDAASYDEIWAAADEQVFPAELRRELAINGFRVGIFGQQLPAVLRDGLDARQQSWEGMSDEVDVTSSDIDARGGNRHLQLRAGHRSKILASKTYPSLAVLLSEEGQVRGHQFQGAQCVLALKPYPQGDGRVKFDLTPEIEHGELKNHWARGEGMLMQRVGRDKLVLDRLRVEALLSPGQWFVVSTTTEMKGLGEHFFTESSAGGVQRSFVLLRLAQTQLDDLFAPAQKSAPLATPGE